MSSLEERLVQNGLNYFELQQINGIASRRMANVNSDSSSIQSGHQMTFRLNCGNAAVYGKNCYLKFNAKSSGENVLSNEGTAFNFIERIDLYSSDGTLLHSRNSRAGDLANKLFRYSLSSSEWLSAQGAVGGGGIAYNGEDGVNVVLPMSFLHGCFSTDTLLPPGSCDGARLVVTTASSDSTDVGVVTFTEMSLMVDEALLSNEVEMAVKSMNASSTGVRIQFDCWRHFPQSLSASASTTGVQQINTVANQLVRAMSSARLTTAKDGTTLKGLSKLNYRVGNQYFPWTPSSSKAEEWLLTQQAFQTAPCALSGGQNLDTIVKGSIPYTGSYNSDTSQPVFAMDLSKSPVGLDLAGIALRNGNQLEFNYTVTPGTVDPSACVIDTFVCNKILAIFHNKNVIVNI